MYYHLGVSVFYIKERYWILNDEKIKIYVFFNINTTKHFYSFG